MATLSIPVRRSAGLSTVLIRLAMLGVAALAFGLRAYNAGAQSFWYDEGISATLAGRDLLQITHDAAMDIHPPFYYYVLHFTAQLAGGSEFAIRFVSVATGAVAACAVYKLGERLLSRAAGLTAALFVSFAPLVIYFGQEARMYSLLLALTTVWTLLFLRLLAADDQSDGGSHRALWVAYFGLGVICVYTHYFAFLLVGVHALWAGIARLRRPRQLLRWVVALGILPLVYVPWFLNMTFAQLDSFQAGQTPLDNATVVVKMLDDFTFGQRAVPDPQARLVFVALLALGVLGSLLGGARMRRGGAFAALYLCLPLAAMLVLNSLRSAYQPRLVMLATPGLYLLFGQGVAWVGGLVARALRGGTVGTPAGALAGAGVLAVAVLPIVNVVPAIYSDPAWQRDDYRGAVRYVEANAKPDDGIILDSPYQGDIVRLYYKGAMPMYPMPLGRPPDRFATEAALAGIVQKHGGIWAMFWGTPETDPQNIVERWLDAHAFKALDRWFGGVRLTQYIVSKDGEMVPLDVRFGDGIHLVGYAWQKRDGAAGEVLPLTLYWEGLKPMDKRYKVFVHLLDENEKIWGQRDSEPAGGARPTNDWRVGEKIEDRIGMPVQADAPQGKYQVEVGLYEYPSMERPQAVDAAGQPLPSNRVLVGPVEVK